MWPGCNNCGAPVPGIKDQYCGGTKCIGKSPSRQATYNPHTKKKLTRAMIKARRKKGRR